MQMSNCVIHFSFVYKEFNTNNVHKILKIWIVESYLQHPFTWKYSIVTENKKNDILILRPSNASSPNPW